MATSLSDACSVVDSLAAFQMDLLRRINKKFAALRNLANLLEQLADLSSWIPSLSGLIPVGKIDVSLYNQIAAQCPYLNLPPATNQLNQLQAAVVQAYTNLFKQVLRSPHFRLGQIQDEMTEFQAKVNNAMGNAGQFIQCLQAVCEAGMAVQSQIGALSNADISKEITKFAEGYVANAGSVLTAPAKAKYQLSVDTLNQLTSLGADVGSDYKTAVSALGIKK